MPLPAIGAAAPSFSLPGSNGRTYALSHYAGKALVLYFYPKDDTSGCTLEGIEFTALKSAFAAAGAEILGVSPDSPKKHDKFCAKHGLGIDLASDEDHALLEAVGIWVEKSMYGRKYMGVERTTLLIDGAGIVRGVWSKVSVPGHAQEVLDAVKKLSA